MIPLQVFSYIYRNTKNRCCPINIELPTETGVLSANSGKMIGFVKSKVLGGCEVAAWNLLKVRHHAFSGWALNNKLIPLSSLPGRTSERGRAP